MPLAVIFGMDFAVDADKGTLSLAHQRQRHSNATLPHTIQAAQFQNVAVLLNREPVDHSNYGGGSFIAIKAKVITTAKMTAMTIQNDLSDLALRRLIK